MRLNDFNAEMGKSSFQDIILENPTSQIIEASYKISNPLNYEIAPNRVILQPKSSNTIKIKFTPTHFEFSETADLTISTSEIGDWRYHLTGKGERPVSVIIQEISCAINSEN